MYWPIAAPNVYALSKHAISTSKLPTSNDGLSNNSDGGKARTPPVYSNISDEEHKTSAILNGDAPGEKGDQGHQNGSADAIHEEDEILDLKVSRGGSTFATITRSSLMVWQTKPTVALAGVVRSPQSLKSYGPNTALLLRPDALIIVLQTALGYLITYSVVNDPGTRVYQTILPESTRHARRPSGDGYGGNFRKATVAPPSTSAGEGDGIREVSVRFRMVIRIDAGISKALALEDELIVATQKPPALQCIKWVAENGASQTSTELISRMQWIGRKVVISEMVHDRPMNLATWISNDGRAFAVQRRNGTDVDPENPKSLFQGFCFREPENDHLAATVLAINARFSLIAIGCQNGQVDVYAVRDYTGNIPLSHKLRLPIGSTTTGNLTCLTYSPDGYCLFAGYEHGWATWTVYGKAIVNTFSADRGYAQINNEAWLHGVQVAVWLGGGCEMAILPKSDNRLWFLDFARNAASSCFNATNISRGLLHSSNSIILYNGHEIADVTALSSDMSVWQSVQIPPSYLAHQWPIKTAVVSSDGKYVAVAGRRGLAHYSVSSGRWRTFEDPQAEREFTVRGGMCWYHHILIASIEANNRHEIRLYSREKALDNAHIQHIEQLPAPAITTTVSGTDSLLVYTYDNSLLHYIVVMSSSSTKLVQVGQIGFHGIIRAPPRVRAISWILPEDQLENGDPSQDVATASVLFLVDGKLVLLQPSTNDSGELKYDMRVIAQNVEYYMLLRDSPVTVASLRSGRFGASTPPVGGMSFEGHLGHSLRDSLWYFDGSGFNVWSDVQDVLACAPAELGRELPPAVVVPLDFAPLSAVVGKGFIAGIEADLVQRRDVNFGFFRHAPMTQLFLPQLLRYHLAEFNSPAALHLSNSYSHLPYFSHALEVLLHDVLDTEVDNPPIPPETALLPNVLSFLSSFSSYLDVIVNCTRKTELRSWRTLFSYLPLAKELFEQSLAQSKLNTAAGYLLVLHAFEQDSFQVREFAQLLLRAAVQQDWELCRELARFLVGIDPSGETLECALYEAGLTKGPNGSLGALRAFSGSGSQITAGDLQRGVEAGDRASQQLDGRNWPPGDMDYFSLVKQATPSDHGKARS